MSSPLSIISLGDVGGDGGVTDRATRGACSIVLFLSLHCTLSLSIVCVLLAYWEKRERGLCSLLSLLVGLRAQLQNRAFLVRDQSAKDHFWVRDRGRQVRDRSPPHTPADGHHRCFWLRHRSKRAQCARRHQASTPVRRAACCVDAFLWLSPRAFWRPGGWENVCRLMCHCVRHISLDSKHLSGAGCVAYLSWR